MTTRKFPHIPLLDTAELEESVRLLEESLKILKANQYADEQGPPEEDPFEPDDYESKSHGY